MKYLSIFTPAATTNVPPSPEHMAEMGKFMEESFKAGVLVSTGGLLPISQGGVRVRRTGGESTVFDGPFPETKEVVAGYATLQTKLTREFLKIAGEGECELRQLLEPGELAASQRK